MQEGRRMKRGESEKRRSLKGRLGGRYKKGKGYEHEGRRKKRRSKSKKAEAKKESEERKKRGGRREGEPRCPSSDAERGAFEVRGWITLLFRP